MRRDRRLQGGKPRGDDKLEQQHFPDDLLLPPIKGDGRGGAGGVAQPRPGVVSNDLVDIFTGGDDLHQDKPPPTEGPRWEHVIQGSFVGLGHFVMRYKEFDIYVYKSHFLLRWGRNPYFRVVEYAKIKATDEERFSIPPDIQAAVLAIRSLQFGEFT